MLKESDKWLVELMLKQLDAFKLIQHQLNIFQHGLKGGGGKRFDIAVQQNRTDVEVVCSGI